MVWYQRKLTKIALRKHMLRIDMRVYCGDPGSNVNPNDQTSVIRSMLMAAIVKGLDVVGIVDPNGPQTGWQALQIAKENQIDLWVIPGEEYQCNDKFRVVVYLLKEKLAPNLSLQQVCSLAEKNGGFVMVMGLTKRQAQNINAIKGQPGSPDAVEIFSAVGSAGYQNMETDYPEFVTSGAKSATELESLFAYTTMNRKEFEGLGLMPEGQGSEYVPKYLERDKAMHEGATPNQVMQEQPAGAQQ